MRFPLAAGIAALLVASTLTSATAAQAATCRDVDARVNVLATTHVVHGTLCTPEGGSGTVQVLIPGATYNSTYWDFPDGTHSFRTAQNAAGFATFTLDRLGTGGSSRPLSVLLTSFVQADAVHQVIDGLRAGAYGPSFSRVVVGGHSLGAAIGVLVAATYPDSVDGVLVTGITHRINTVGFALAFANFVPANLDPKFGLLYPVGYLTTAPGTRYASFTAPAVRIPTVQTIEESTKDVFSPTEAADALGFGMLLPYSLQITAPVLVVVGGQDSCLCGLLATDCSSSAGLRASEAPYYNADLETLIVPGAGHSLNLASSVGEYHATVSSWVTRKVVG
ncbi:alpha/beta hydrolase [Saccharothrix violaceirubra]|uniref:Pimeloyl-ACP methyl ester carboxylesterase n=1 Tax=Saccharothrix violaceirubra TaxID=413306 RepID=A0A7W7WVN7_9PSEU|nr:alpha/beta hydrolase [Saccharothrix violaceirubra]MBB4965281.1 pimeloyl-ACP methyl ester carboxylesterase [Saccharothrix violaceirubra]